jgi:ankyrin repeat protein
VKLLAFREDVQAESKDDDGRTPLLWAAAYGSKATVELLVQTSDVDAIDDHGWTALQLAPLNAHTEVEQFLLQKGASEPNDFYGLQTLFCGTKTCIV